RLEVAVDDAALVRVVDGPGQRLHQPGRRAGRLRPGGGPLGQGAAVHVLEGQVGVAVVLADLVDLHDVGVLQAGPPPRPPARAGPRPRVGWGARPRWSPPCRALSTTPMPPRPSTPSTS